MTIHVIGKIIDLKNVALMFKNNLIFNMAAMQCMKVLICVFT